MDLEKLIAVKRSDLDKEKMLLGLIPQTQSNVTKVPKAVESNNKINLGKQVTYEEKRVAENDDESVQEEDKHAKLYELEEKIPPDLERYIRKYIGLPGMLKTGEYSPNNPLTRSERASGDVFLGLGEYERRRNTLRKIRQQQYKEYLDEQAKKKQEAKEKTQKERRDREDRERLREERERERLERERERSPELRRTNINYGYQTANSNNSSNSSYSNKVDTGVQVEFINRPLSVAVQTDDAEFFPLSFPHHAKLTLAERELSPRCVIEADDRAIQPATKQAWDQKKSYHFDAEPPFLKKSNRDKLKSDLKHTYMPSIFDADAIELRNIQAEKEAAERRQYYQQELKNQIEEQQRIREERKAREKMLEQAEMRRLEEQLRMLRMAQEKEIDRQHDFTNTMKENSKEYEIKRKNLQKEIDLEHASILRSRSQPCRVISNRNTYTSQSDSSQNVSKLPFYYPNINEISKEMYDEEKRQPFSINMPENSVFPNYDVDSYLRRNLNPSKENFNKFNDSEIDTLKNIENKPKRFSFGEDFEHNNFETPILKERPKEKLPNLVKITEKPRKHDLIKRMDTKDAIDESLPIPVLRHSPKHDVTLQNNSDKLSDAMKLVEDKWKVPAVQKNILKSFPSANGKNINILTQLGSIRRQLQLEQLKLDQKMMKNENTT